MESVVIYEKGTSTHMASAVVPEGWNCAGKFFSKAYGGPESPVDYLIKAVNKACDTCISIRPTYSYIDNREAKTYGVEFSSDGLFLIRKYRPFEQFCDQTVEDVFNESKVTFIEERQNNLCTKANNTNDVCESGIRIYKITNPDGSETIHTMSLKIEKSITTLYNEESAIYEGKILWKLTDFFTLDSPLEGFETNYKHLINFMTSYSVSEETKNRERVQAEKLAQKRKERSKKEAGNSATSTVTKKMTVKDEYGINALIAELPENWEIKSKRYNENFGYGYPFGFYVYCANREKTISMQYTSPIFYLDAPAEANGEYYRTFGKSSYSSLIRSYMSLEDYMDEHAKLEFPKLGLRFVKQLESVRTPGFDYRRRSQELYNETLEKYKSRTEPRRLDMRLINEIVRVYEYTTSNGTRRLMAYLTRINVTGYTDFKRIPSEFMSMNNVSGGFAGLGPNGMLSNILGSFGASATGSLYSNAVSDGNGGFLEPTPSEISWFVSNRIRLDAAEGDFDEAYNGVFRQFCKSASMHDDIKAVMEEMQKAIDEDDVEARRIFNETLTNRSKAQTERMDITRRTNQEITDIYKSAHDNTQRAYDRANKRWSETFNERYTYTDRYGSEYRVRGHGKYTYKRGTTIINTDNPYPPGYDWEELKKN